MRMRWGPGPVFVYEWLVRSRNWRMYAQRVLFAGAVLAGLVLMWTTMRENFAGKISANGTASIQDLAQLGEMLYRTVVFVELTMVLLVAPAATAGAICTDKMRGTLEHMLVTDLSNGEIVLGKFAARLAPVLGLIACVLPITALSGLFGGIDPMALGGSFLVAIGCAVLACTLALLVSVWGRKAHEVLMLTYLLIVLWLILPILVQAGVDLLTRPSGPVSVPAWFDWVVLSNPYVLAIRPYSWPGSVGWPAYIVFFGVCLGLSALMAGWATWRVRAVAAKQAGAGVRPRGRALSWRFGSRLWERARRFNPLWYLPGPSLDGNPVLWREWHRARPSRMLRTAWLMYAALGLLGTATVYHAAIVPTSPWQGWIVGVAAYANTFQVALGLLLLSVGASTSLGEERARGSLDLLMSTPLSTRSILAGKWWGTFRQAVRILLWPAATGALLVTLDLRRAFLCVISLGLISAYGAVVVSLGLLLAVCVRQPGRAVVLCVAIVVGLAVGWIFLIMFIVIGSGAPHDRATEGLVFSMLMGSPLAGTPFSTLAMDLTHGPGGRGPVDLVWCVPSACAWTMALWCAAGLLYLVALGEFEPRLGRMPEEDDVPVRPRSRPARPNRALDMDDAILSAEGVTVLEARDDDGPAADGIAFLDAEAGVQRAAEGP